MAWTTGTGPRYAPPPTVAGVLSGGLASMGDRLRAFALQDREDERIAMLDQRDESRYQTGLARDDEALFTDLALRYGATPVASPAPTMGEKILAPVPGGSQASAGSMGDRLAATVSAAPSAPQNTLSVRGRTLSVDPSRSFDGMRDTQAQAQATAERLRLFTSARESALAAGASDGEATAYANEQANGFQPYVWQPRTQEQQRGEVTFGTDEQIRAGAPGRALERERIDISRAAEARAAAGGNGGAAADATEGERKSSGFLGRALNSNPILDRFTSRPSDTSLVGLPIIGNRLASTPAQAYDQAAQDFISAVLRMESGASIPDSEFDRMARVYLPQNGDDESTIAAKRRSRELAIEALRTGAGVLAPEASAATAGETGPTRSNLLRQRTADLKAQGKSEQEARAILQREGLL